MKRIWKGLLVLWFSIGSLITLRATEIIQSTFYFVALAVALAIYGVWLWNFSNEKKTGGLR